ncbi:hypothetical protein FSP39_021587 [Pinctada imbricata]|uniref:Pyruvate dehydrogenase phosphatase regulatory subunit, mitochondrial n=1 Tax=Pinctada imbricata TaxID=66713 RepID=A0AA88XSE8_PINIB|nr:hypothetical protein FSP39_021587 [Pinctada imbricata]
MSLLRHLYNASQRKLIPGLTCCARNYSGVASGEEQNGAPQVDLPKHARVVICGGGVLGTSVAYHLADRGWQDIVLLEQGKFTCGTTWHSAGLIGQAKDDIATSKLIKYSRDLYKSFEDSGEHVGWKQCGSLMMAQTKERLIYLQRKKAVAIATGIDCHILTPEEIKKMNSWVRTDDIEGGLWIPGDGALSAPDVAVVFSRLAKKKGVKMYEGVEVNQINTTNQKVSGVETSHGNIQCDYFVNCSGLWSRQVGKKSEPRVMVPLHACEHFYITTTPINGMDPMLPVIRDYDGLVYFREWSGGILAGGFEPVAKPAFHKKIPDNFQFQLLPDDWDHFQILLDSILHRMPAMENANVQKMFNGPESFTPDGHWVLGESSEVKNFFVSAGMCSTGIVGAGGVGKHLSEWIIDGQPSIDLSHHDIQRFVPHHNNRQFLQERVKETLGMYTLKYPTEQWNRGRCLRTSPLHTRLEQGGACFAETNAYERAVWFDWSSPGELLDQYNIPKGAGTYKKPYWFDNIREEYWACREHVCLVDMSSFTKSEIRSKGPEALKFLQYLSSNDIDQPLGTVIHTGMQNKQGGYENDCTIVPLYNNRYFMISPTSQQTRSINWLQDNLPEDGSVELQDVTSAYAGINVIGPHAPQLLADVSDTSTSLQDFKPMTAKVIDVGYAGGIIAMRLTHAGEEGFVLYIPSEYALHVYDVLTKAGKVYGIRNAGYYALRMMRVEKFYAFWNHDISTMTTPMECGREFRVKFDKGDFIGRDALLEQKKKGISQRFAQFLLKDYDKDNDVWPWGGEPIYRNGKFCGTTTSSGYGFKVDRMICLGYVVDYDDNGNRVLHQDMRSFVMDKDANYEIEIGGTRFPAEVKIHTMPQAYSKTPPVFIPTPDRPQNST